MGITGRRARGDGTAVPGRRFFFGIPRAWRRP